jgi:hypothetical protein
MSDEDAQALTAFLMSQKSQKSSAPAKAARSGPAKQEVAKQ